MNELEKQIREMEKENQELKGMIKDYEYITENQKTKIKI